MKKDKWIILLFLLTLSACVTTDYWKLKTEIPRKVEVDLKKYNSVVVAPFLVKEGIPEFDLNKEIVEYLAGELTRKAGNTILTSNIAVEKEEQFESPEYWQNLEDDSEGNLYITGSAQYTEETRKALIKPGRRRFEDPFPDPAKLEQRKFYNLNVHLYIIDAKTGIPVFKREFKETKSYTNPNQTGYNAFFDLILQVKEKLFRAVLGEGRLEERYLIIKNQE